jgi:hypothetical protein
MSQQQPQTEGFDKWFESQFNIVTLPNVCKVCSSNVVTLCDHMIPFDELKKEPFSTASSIDSMKIGMAVMKETFVHDRYTHLYTLLKQHFPGCIIANEEDKQYVLTIWKCTYSRIFTFKTVFEWDETINSLAKDCNLGSGTTLSIVAFHILWIENDGLFVSVYKNQNEQQ